MTRTEAYIEFDRLDAAHRAELVRLYGSEARHAAYDRRRNGCFWIDGAGTLCDLYAERVAAFNVWHAMVQDEQSRDFQRVEARRMKAQR
jgi:hypothetical protein